MGRIGLEFSEKVLNAVAILVKYEGHISRDQQINVKFGKLRIKRINWKMLVDNKNISYECRLRISKIMPETFFQLENIDGIRPATLSYVAGLIS